MLVAALAANAQNHETYFCGQVAAREKLFRSHPGAREESIRANQELEEHTRNFSENRGGGSATYIIPVVFHVIHMNGAENISDDQIYDAVSILTRDFRKLNADTSEIVDAFVDIAADCNIEFRLATKDPNGNCHTGINRIVSDLTYDGGNPDMKDLISWPRNSYLQIWVCAAIGDGVAGFTNLPGDVSSNWAADGDGIVMRSDYVGSIGTSSPTKSRSLTHEVGHWLNLYHTWGPTNNPGETGNCDFDDLVNDTPNTIGYTSCNLNGNSCGGGVDNVQNYMEYSYCSCMYTQGQRTRMIAALTSGTAQRNQLWTQANLLETGVLDPPLCEAAFSSTLLTACVGDTIVFSDESYHNITSWSWNFGDGQQISGSDPLLHKNPGHAYENPGVYTVSLTVGNGSSSLNTNGTIVILGDASASSPVIEGFEGTWPGNLWLTNNPQGDETWEITPTASFTDDKSLKLRNYNIEAGNLDEFYSATLDMTGADTVWLSYRWAYANRPSETDDRLKISVSGDCGQTWSLRKLRKGLTNLPTADPVSTQFVPTSTDQWDGETLVLTNGAWFNDRFRVKFDFTSYGGNNLYLDDINIIGSFTTGVREAIPVFIYNVYPNPSENGMTLELVQQDNEQVSLELYNATGQLCQVLQNGSLSGGRHFIQIDDQPAGLYNLVMRKEGHVSVQKLIFR